MTSSVTIIITVLNQAPHLRMTIESILNQTYEDFVLIVRDEGATDFSMQIAQHYAKQDNRVRVVVGNEGNQLSNLKSALALTDSEYLGWVNCGDLLAETTLEETVNVLKGQPTVGTVYTDYLSIDETHSVNHHSAPTSNAYSEERLLTDFIISQFRLVRRSAYHQVGGINDLIPHCQDYDLFLKISEVTEIYHLQKPLYYYRLRKCSTPCYEQIEKILWAKEVVEQAIKRRQKTDEYELEVQLFSTCSLSNKSC
jgi:glycosyltransferase involved in cell wall biosynthesis